MSTRSLIGIKKETGITFIYCHNDGYPDGVGATLLNNYKDVETIDKLMSLGDMSSLGNKPIENPYGWDIGKYIEANATKEGSYAWDSMCVTYKNRGETNVDARTVNTVEEFIDSQDDASYYYLYEDGEWYVYAYGKTDQRKKVADVI